METELLLGEAGAAAMCFERLTVLLLLVRPHAFVMLGCAAVLLY